MAPSLSHLFSDVGAILCKEFAQNAVRRFVSYIEISAGKDMSLLLYRRF
jgi:hypothetical protein